MVPRKAVPISSGRHMTVVNNGCLYGDHELGYVTHNIYERRVNRLKTCIKKLTIGK